MQGRQSMCVMEAITSKERRERKRRGSCPGELQGDKNLPLTNLLCSEGNMVTAHSDFSKTVWPGVSLDWSLPWTYSFTSSVQEPPTHFSRQSERQTLPPFLLWSLWICWSWQPLTGHNGGPKVAAVKAAVFVSSPTSLSTPFILMSLCLNDKMSLSFWFCPSASFWGPWTLTINLLVSKHSFVFAFPCFLNLWASSEGRSC